MHYSWLIDLELQRSITVCPWLPLVVPSNHEFVGDNREFEVYGIFLAVIAIISV